MLVDAKEVKELQGLEPDRGLIILDVDTGAIYSANAANARFWTALSKTSSQILHTSDDSIQPPQRDAYLLTNRSGVETTIREESGRIPSRILLTVRAWLELVFYDWRIRRGGFGRIHRRLTAQWVEKRASVPALKTELCEAVNLAACFYCKPVKCLQRSVVTVCLLRKYGINASLVIGCRPSPFFAHAWAEVDREVLNDLAGYKQELIVLYRQEPSCETEKRI